LLADVLACQYAHTVDAKCYPFPCQTLTRSNSPFWGYFSLSGRAFLGAISPSVLPLGKAHLGLKFSLKIRFYSGFCTIFSIIHIILLAPMRKGANSAGLDGYHSEDGQSIRLSPSSISGQETASGCVKPMESKHRNSRLRHPHSLE
jgi:hypothetical protein